jgi:hypothetical protein
MFNQEYSALTGFLSRHNSTSAFNLNEDFKDIAVCRLESQGRWQKEAKEDEKKAFADINIIVGKWQYFNIFSLSFRRRFFALFLFFMLHY